MKPRQVHRSSTVVLSALMVVIGCVLVIQDVAVGGDVLSARLLLGILFAAVGVGRIYLESRRGRGGTGSGD
jgi:hypothetical protein